MIEKLALPRSARITEKCRDSVHQIAATHNCLRQFNVKAVRHMEAMDHQDYWNLYQYKWIEYLQHELWSDVAYYHLGNFMKATTVLEGACSIQREVIGNYHRRVAKNCIIWPSSNRQWVRYDIDQSLHFWTRQSRSSYQQLDSTIQTIFPLNLEIARRRSNK